jgi:prepilin-type N-terminal cleavage/methylation domain-containing protein
MKLEACSVPMQGFSLIEMMIATSIVAFGLLAAGQLLYVAAGNSSLARAKSTAALAAQNALESLGSVYRQNPAAADLTLGRHGPRTYAVTNPANAALLNRYAVEWTVESIPDPRPAITLNARSVRATVTPIAQNGSGNSRPGLNKTLSITTVLSQEMK